MNNLTNEMPPRDFSNIDYPSYNFNWYDTIGRAYYLNFTWTFGGEPLQLPIRIWKSPPEGGLSLTLLSNKGKGHVRKRMGAGCGYPWVRKIGRESCEESVGQYG